MSADGVFESYDNVTSTSAPRRKTRIELTDTTMSMLMKMSEGNPRGAFSVHEAAPGGCRL